MSRYLQSVTVHTRPVLSNRQRGHLKVLGTKRSGGRHAVFYRDHAEERAYPGGQTRPILAAANYNSVFSVYDFPLSLRLSCLPFLEAALP